VTDPTELVMYPGAIAIACSIVVDEIVMGALYCAEEEVGTLPSVV
jgi:hypothetical protein